MDQESGAQESEQASFSVTLPCPHCQNPKTWTFKNEVWATYGDKLRGGEPPRKHKCENCGKKYELREDGQGNPVAEFPREGNSSGNLSPAGRPTAGRSDSSLGLDPSISPVAGGGRALPTAGSAGHLGADETAPAMATPPAKKSSGQSGKSGGTNRTSTSDSLPGPSPSTVSRQASAADSPSTSHARPGGHAQPQLGAEVAELLQKLERQTTAAVGKILADINLASERIGSVTLSTSYLPDTVEAAFKPVESHIQKINEDLKPTVQDVEDLRQRIATMLRKVFEGVTVISTTFDKMNEVAKRVSDAAKEAAQRQGAAVNPQQAPRAEASLSAKAIEELVARLRGEVFAPDRVRAYLDQFQGETQDKIVRLLPSLFEHNDLALYSYRYGRHDNLSPEVRQKVVEVLETLQGRIHDWQNQVGLVRLGRENERFDSVKHERRGCEETDDPQKANTLKEVICSGYQLIGHDEVLRRALVIGWVESRGNGAPPAEDRTSAEDETKT